MNVREILAEVDPEILCADGFDEAIMGYIWRCGQPIFAIYDRDKCIEILMSRDGMDQDEAEEFFDFNVSGAWVGPRTPGFLVRVDDQSA